MFQLEVVFEDRVTFNKILEKLDLVSFARIRRTNRSLKNYFLKYGHQLAVPIRANCWLHLSKKHGGSRRSKYPYVNVYLKDKRTIFRKVAARGRDGDEVPETFRRELEMDLEGSRIALTGFVFYDVSMEVASLDDVPQMLEVLGAFKRVRQLCIYPIKFQEVQNVIPTTMFHSVYLVGEWTELQSLNEKVKRVTLRCDSLRAEVNFPEVYRLVRNREVFKYDLHLRLDLTTVLNFALMVVRDWIHGRTSLKHFRLDRATIGLENREEETVDVLKELSYIRCILDGDCCQIDRQVAKSLTSKKDEVAHRQIYLSQDSGKWAVLTLDTPEDHPTKYRYIHFRELGNLALELPPFLSAYFADYPIDFSGMSLALENDAYDLEAVETVSRTFYNDLWEFYEGCKRPQF